MNRRITDVSAVGVLVFRSALLLLLIAGSAWMMGCASNPQLPVQYATLKLIERDTVTATDVIEGVDCVRALLVDGVTLTDLGGRVRSVVGYQEMMPSDRLLVDAILGDVAHRLDVSYDVPLSAEHLAAIVATLDWIDQAARLYQ